MIAALSWADLIVVVLAFVLGFCIGYVVHSTEDGLVRRET